MLDWAVRRRQRLIFIFPLIKGDITVRWGGDLPENIFRQTSLWSLVLRAALPTDWERERAQESLAVFTQYNGNRQSRFTSWKHLLVFRKFRPPCKKEETLFLRLWTCLFFSPPSTSRSHFHLFPSLRHAFGQDESKCLNTSVRVS